MQADIISLAEAFASRNARFSLVRAKVRRPESVTGCGFYDEH